jgi:AbrB family looped-hinge helix DNA binding protein
MPKMTTGGRVTIPVQIRRALQLRAGDLVDFVEVKKGEFAISAVRKDQQKKKTTLRKREN